MLQRSRRIFVVTFPYSVEKQRELRRPPHLANPFQAQPDRADYPCWPYSYRLKEFYWFWRVNLTVFGDQEFLESSSLLSSLKGVLIHAINSQKNVTEQNISLAIDSNLNFDILLPNLSKWSFSTVDVVLVKLKGKIVKNTCRCTEILYQWKFQIQLRNLTLKQDISENDSTIRFWTL